MLDLEAGCCGFVSVLGEMSRGGSSEYPGSSIGKMSLKMKKLCFAFIGALSLLTAEVCADDRPTAIDDFYATQERTRVIAHRGFSGAAPENTLAAVRAAIEVGADMVEIDVTLTSDGHIVVIHDETLDRTTTGSGRVSDFTLTELQRLDAGGWFAPRFAGERIPTLDQVLDEIEGRILLNVEIKSEAVERGIVTKVASAIRKRGMMEQLWFPRFHRQPCSRCISMRRKFDPRSCTT